MSFKRIKREPSSTGEKKKENLILEKQIIVLRRLTKAQCYAYQSWRKSRALLLPTFVGVGESGEIDRCLVCRTGCFIEYVDLHSI